MKKTLKTIILLALSFQALAMDHPIVCQTPQGNKGFTIFKSHVAFHKGGLDQKRVPASIKKIRTKKTTRGFSKVLFYEGKKYTLHVDNTKSFSWVNDYVVVRNKSGHEITYPLECWVRD